MTRAWDYGAIPAFAAHLYATEEGLFFARPETERGPALPQSEADHAQGAAPRPIPVRTREVEP